MKWTLSIIWACYAYIFGLIWAMWFPGSPPVLFGAQLLAVLLLIGVVGLIIHILRAPTVRPWGRPGYWTCLLLGMMAFGYGRYHAADTVPDRQIGTIQLTANQATYRERAQLNEAHRLRLVTHTDSSEDVQLRIHGTLVARTPVQDDGGVHRMDAAHRWLFEQVQVPLTSEIITIRSDDPAGTAYWIDQPFSRIEKVEVVAGAARGEVEVYRVSNHIGSFVRARDEQSEVTVLGRITHDPRVYDFQTVLIVTPTFIQYPAGGPFYRVDGGDIQVTVTPGVEGYTEWARTAAYGADVQIRGELTVAGGPANPGGFDARQFMRNYNIYGLMRPFQLRGAPPPMHPVVAEGASETRTGHGLVAFSLELRDRILLLFKATMPYPQSAFLGGVTLGLRYGLQNAEFPGAEGEGTTWAERLGLRPSEAQIVDDFRHSGVNHVLAVSGLHVTILTVMFVALFTLLRFPKQVFVPFVIFALVVFAIITGARPSTLRAVIMNSLFLLTWGYLNRGLLSSVLLGVPVAAFLILLHNPLVVVDPSFTLSFGAILSLALITMPVHELCARLQSNRLLAVGLWVLATTWIGIVHWALITTPLFIFPWLAVGVGLYAVALRAEQRGWALSTRLAFTGLPEPISTFIAAQVAIQVGMMLPLSAYYFLRWPFAGAYVNLLAIPLIGVVVQLGAIGGLLGLIPLVGPWLTLLLNAANWVFATFFLWLAHVTALLFPHPFVRRPRVVEIVVYYLLLAAFLWRKPLWQRLQQFSARCGWTSRRGPVTLGLIGLVLVLQPLWIFPPRDTREPGMHVTVFDVRYGSAILVESPGGQKILIDSGFVQHDRGRRNEALRTLLPYFSHAAIRELDGIILTSPLPERSAGLAYVLEHMRVRRLYVPSTLAGLSPAWSFDTFLDQFGSPARLLADYDEERLRRMYHELVGHPEWPRRPSLAQAMAARGDGWPSRLSGRKLDVQAPQPGDVLFTEDTSDGRFAIEVLDTGFTRGDSWPIENQGLALRIVHGDIAVLVPGALHYSGQAALATTDQPVQAQLMVVPHQGAASPSRAARPPRTLVDAALQNYSGALLAAVEPEWVLFEYGTPRPVLSDRWRTAQDMHEFTRQFYARQLGRDALLSTDQHHAIFIHSDGIQYTLDTQAWRNRTARDGEADAGSQWPASAVRREIVTGGFSPE